MQTNKNRKKSYDPKRGLRKYKPETTEKVFERLKKLTNYQPGVYTLIDIVERELDETLRARFIQDALKFIDGFDSYFKNISRVPGEYLIPVFHYYERWSVGSTSERFKAFIYAVDHTGYKNPERVKSYVDCLYRSCINQTKRYLGLFGRGNTISKHVAVGKEVLPCP